MFHDLDPPELAHISTSQNCQSVVMNFRDVTPSYSVLAAEAGNIYKAVALESEISLC